MQVTWRPGRVLRCEQPPLTSPDTIYIFSEEESVPTGTCHRVGPHVHVPSSRSPRARAIEPRRAPGGPHAANTSLRGGLRRQHAEGAAPESVLSKVFPPFSLSPSLLFSLPPRPARPPRAHTTLGAPPGGKRGEDNGVREGRRRNPEGTARRTPPTRPRGSGPGVLYRGGRGGPSCGS